MGRSPFPACSRDGHVLHGYAVRRHHNVGLVHACSLLARQRFLYQCMEAAETPYGQYGHTGGGQYGNRIPVQRLQCTFPRLLAFKRNRASCIFRVVKRDYRLHPSRQAPGGKGKREYFRCDKETNGPPAAYCDSGGRCRIQDCPDKCGEAR